MKLLCCLFLAACTQSVVLGSRCVKPQSKNCVVHFLSSLDGSPDVLPTELQDKTSLQIKGGNLTVFSEKMATQLKTVQKLFLGRLGLQQLFLNTELLDVAAPDNEIHEVLFKITDLTFKLQKLDLQNNHLQHLGGFQVLTDLRELYLQHNQLETIDLSIFAQMQKLEQLHLAGNQLTSVAATNGIDLAALEYLSLASNKLTKLDVSSWKLSVLATWDVSSNELIYIHGITLENQFPFLETMLLSNNGWHCKWLEETLNMFENYSVKVDDKNTELECDIREGICCVSVEVFEDNGLGRLENISKDQKNLREDLQTNIKALKDDQDDKLKTLERLVDNLQEKLKIPVTPTEKFNLEEFRKLKSQAEELKSTLSEELKTCEQDSNEKLVKSLERTIVQLRKSLLDEVAKIARLQKEFKLLKEHVNAQN